MIIACKICAYVLRNVGIMVIVVGMIVLGSELVLSFRGLGGGGGIIQSTHRVNVVNGLITVNANARAEQAFAYRAQP